MVPNTAPTTVITNFIILLFSFLLKRRYIATIGIAKKTKNIPGTMNNSGCVPVLFLNIFYTSFPEKVLELNTLTLNISYRRIVINKITRRGLEPKFSFSSTNFLQKIQNEKNFSLEKLMCGRGVLF